MFVQIRCMFQLKSEKISYVISPKSHVSQMMCVKQFLNDTTFSTSNCFWIKENDDEVMSHLSPNTELHGSERKWKTN